MATLTIIIVMNCLMMMFIYSSNYANKDTFTTIILYLVPATIIIMCLALYKIMIRLSDNEVLREKLPEEQRKITLKATIQAGHLMIKTENPCLSVKTDEHGKIQTTKKDRENHGFGLSLIEDIAKKYDGHFETNINNNSFIATASFKINN